MKRPSFQFYPGDWLNDVALRSCSMGARGLWIDMICLMHQGSEYGHLKVNHKVILTPNLARILGSTLAEVEGWLVELENAGVYSKTEDGCIYSRRMIRDEKIRESRASGGILGGNPSLRKVNLTPNLRPTPSSSSSSSSSFSTPSIKEVLTECSMRGIPAEHGTNFWNHFESVGWVNKHNQPIKDWRPKLHGWSVSERNSKGERNHKINGSKREQTDEEMLREAQG